MAPSAPTHQPPGTATPSNLPDDSPTRPDWRPSADLLRESVRPPAEQPAKPTFDLDEEETVDQGGGSRQDGRLAVSSD